MAQMNDLPFHQQLRRFGSLAQNPAHKGRMLLTTGESSLVTPNPSPKVWSFSKDGFVWVRDGRTGEVLAEIQSKGKFPRCFLEVDEFKEVWVGHSDGTVRAFQAVEPFSLVEDVIGGNITSGGANAITRPEPDNDGILFPSGATPIFVGFGDNLIWAVDADSKKLLHKLQGHTHSVRALVCCREFLLSGGEDGLVLVWDTADRNTSGTRPVNQLLALPQSGGGGGKHEVTALCISRKAMPEAELLWVGTSRGHIKIINMNNGALLKTYHAPSAPVVQIACVENVIYVCSHSASALRYDGTNMDPIRCHVDVEDERSMDSPRRPKHSSHDAPTPHSHNHNGASASHGIDWVVPVAQAHLTVHWAVGGDVTDFSAFRQEGFDALDLEALAGKRRQYMEQCIRKVRADIQRNQEKLDLRLNPPQDKDLERAVAKSRTVKTQISHTVSCHTQLQERRTDRNTQRRIFFDWWLTTIRHKIRRFERKAHWKAVANAALVLRPYFVTWEVWGRQMIVKNIKLRKAMQLCNKNAKPILGRYWAFYTTYTGRRAAMRRVWQSTVAGKLAMARPYFKRLQKYRDRQYKLRRLTKVAGILLRNLDSLMRREFFGNWKRWIDFQSKERGRIAFINSVSGKSRDMVRKSYFLKWVRARAVLRDRRRQFEHKSRFLRGFGTGLLCSYYFQWVKARDIGRSVGLKRSSTDLFARATSMGLTRAYFYPWKQRADRKIADRIAGRKTSTASSFIGFLQKDGLLRPFYKRWQEFGVAKLKQRRQVRSLEVLLGGSASGTRRLVWSKWSAYVQHRRAQRSKQNIITTFLRGFTIGLQAVYFAKLRKNSIERQTQKQQLRLTATLVLFNERDLRTSYYNKWKRWMQIKKRVNYIAALISVEPDDCQRRYYNKWAAFLIRRSTEVKKKVLANQQAMALRKKDLEGKLDEVVRKITLEKWQLQNLVAERSEAEGRLRGASTAAQNRERELDMLHAKNEKSESRIRLGNEDIYRYREALGRGKERPPIKMASQWLYDWKELESLAKSLRNDLADDRVALRKADIDDRLEIMAVKSVSAHRVLAADLQDLQLAQPRFKKTAQRVNDQEPLEPPEQEIHDVEDENYVYHEDDLTEAEAENAAKIVG